MKTYINIEAGVEIQKIELISDANERFLFEYKVSYKKLGEDKLLTWCMASRIKNLDKLSPEEFCTQKTKDKEKKDIIKELLKPSAVRILPYYFDEKGEKNILFIRQYRVPLSKFIYELPAGLVENFNAKVTSLLEISEETNTKAVRGSLKKILGKAFVSAGASNETEECYEMEVKGDFNQKNKNIGEQEILTVIPVKFKDIPKFITKHESEMCSRSASIALIYYYKNINKL